MQDFLKINEKDNVAVALRDVAAGTGYQDSAEALEAAGTDSADGGTASKAQDRKSVV